MVFISLCVVSLAVLAIGVSIRFVVDSSFVNHSLHQLNESAVVTIIVIIFLVFGSYTRSLLINSICENVITDIRKSIYQKLILLEPSFYETHKTSDIISRLTNDATLVQTTIANVFSFFLRNSFMVIGSFTMLLLTSSKLTLHVLFVVPFLMIPIKIIASKLRQLSKQSQEKIGLASAHVEETLNAIKTVQAYTNEQHAIKQYNQSMQEALSSTLSRIRYRSFLTSLVIFLISIAITYVIWTGGQDVIAGSISSGELVAFIYYAILLASSISGISEVITELSKAAGAADRICELLFVDHACVSFNNILTINAYDIRFDHVNFAYPARPESNILSDLSFTIKQGEKVAIVGVSGGGKSTIFQLLLRFYQISSGNICIGERDIKDCDLAELRHNIALVSQDPVIFSASAYDNILYGRLDASEEELVEAAKLANIYDFLDGLPEKMNSFLGEKGVRLSGGQKQRISIARAILKNPRILLLDEATNSLDSENEALVQDTLENFMQDRTAIIIAHRLSTIKGVDRILVLDQGRIIETGKHEELMSLKGQYYNLISKYYV